MILAHRVALNGTQLDSLDSRINIKAVEEGAGKDTIGAAATGRRSGQRIQTRRRETLDVVVKFSILEPDSLTARETVLEAVNNWAAGGGILTLNYRTGRQLNVVCAQCPGAGDAYEWTTVYAITFRAYEVPYWEESTAATGTDSGDTGSVSLTVNGSAETVAEVSFKNTSGSTVDTFSVTAGDSTIAFTDLGLANNETLEIDHDGKLIRIRIKGTGGTYRSAMGKRTAASDDDLYILPGSRTVSYTAAGSGSFTASVRGRFA